MSVKDKVYAGLMKVERPDHGKIYQNKKEVIPLIITYKEGGISSGIMVAIQPEYYELVMKAFSHIEKVTGQQQVVDNLVNQSGNLIHVSTPGIALPRNGRVQ